MKTNGSMNRCYRLVWSQVQQAWMAGAETTRNAVTTRTVA